MARSGSLPPLVLGTWNRKKGLELAQLLEPLGLELRTLADLPGATPVEESGETFAENAERKAVELSRRLGQWVLADDSGLCVDALDGAPGVRSARYAGPEADDQANNEKLLRELQAVPDPRRTARFVCHAVVADPEGAVRARSEACCRGRIRRSPAGQGGFGYDPLFEIPEYGKTLAELGPAVKGLLSHRGRAIRRLTPQLAALIRTGQWR